MTFPLWYLLVVYTVFLLGYAVVGLIHVYHLSRFGLSGPRISSSITIFVIGVVFLLTISAAALERYPWSEPVEVPLFSNTLGGSASFPSL